MTAESALLAAVVRAARKALASPMRPGGWALEGGVALEPRGKGLWRAMLDPADPLRLRHLSTGRCLCPAFREMDTDLASVPRIAQAAGKASKALHLSPDSFARSAVFHDALYSAGWCWVVEAGKASHSRVTRAQADAILYLCLRCEGATVADGLAYWNGVRLGGASRWRAARQLPEEWPPLFDSPTIKPPNCQTTKLPNHQTAKSESRTMKRIALLPLLLSLALSAPAQSTNDYALRSDLAAYAPLSALAGYVTFSALADYALISDLSAYPPISDLSAYATQSSLTNYALRSDLSAYATSSDLAGFLTTEDLSDYALTSDLTAYATASDLADYATASDLSDAVSNALASVSNSFLGAYAYTSGTNTVWRVPTRTEFDKPIEAFEQATFDGVADFEAEAIFNDSVTFDGMTRLHWTDLQAQTVVGDTVTAAHGDDIIWSDPNGDECFVYLPAETNAPTHTRSIVVRDFSDEPNTTVYAGTTNSAVELLTLTSTNATAVFDWCPDAQRWIPR